MKRTDWRRNPQERSLEPPDDDEPEDYGTEPDYGGVLGADGRVYSDADEGL